MLIGTLVVFAWGAACRRHSDQPVEPPPPIVEAAVPVEQEMTDFQVFTARTQATQSVEVRPRVTGYLTKIGFTDGEEVSEGRVLFEIDDRPYQAALEQAKGQLAIAQAALLRAEAELEIGLQTQQKNPGAISKQDLARRQGSRDEAAGSVEAAKGVLAQAELNLSWCSVTAPIAGRTDRHFVDVGNLVTQNTTTLTNIVSLKPIWAYFDVDENTAIRVQKLEREGAIRSVRGSHVAVHMAIGAGSDFAYSGVVDFISNQLDPNTGSIRCRAVFTNDDQNLVAGMFGRIRVPVGGPHRALLVRDSAVGTQQGQSYVLVVNDQDVVERRMVDVGPICDGLRAVLGTRVINRTNPDGSTASTDVVVLRPSDRVIVNGLQRVRPDAKVSPRMVDMVTMMPGGARGASSGPSGR